MSVSTLTPPNLSFEIRVPASSIELVFPEGLSHDAFEELCFTNKQLRIEREPSGKIIIMSPVAPYSGDNEAEFIADLKLYARQNGGRAYSSQVGFLLPDSSVRMPDASYVTEADAEKYTTEELKHFVLLIPVFIVEVISPSDKLSVAKRKMTETWMANGVRLGWLVDVENEMLWIYRQDGSIETVSGFDRTIDGEDVISGFEFDLRNLM
jgi:Uma2 family endonuclease